MVLCAAAIQRRARRIWVIRAGVGRSRMSIHVGRPPNTGRKFNALVPVAKPLGLDVPPTLLIRAHELIVAKLISRTDVKATIESLAEIGYKE
jgi:hypothetical protein